MCDSLFIERKEVIMAKTIDIECSRLRFEIRKALIRIFSGELAGARAEDLFVVMGFMEHAKHCESCQALRVELVRAMTVFCDALQ